MNKILINGNFLCRNLTGIERFAFETCRNLDNLLDEKADISILVPANAKVIPQYKNIKLIKSKKEIQTDFGETLSWEYLCYVREHPIVWTIPTHILYGENDNLTSYETISEFANRIKASLTVMKNGEHWFHTEEQMKFLDNWLKKSIR